MKRILLILLSTFIISGISFSQTKWQINFYGGYSLPFADLKGSFPDSLSSSGLDFTKASTLLTLHGFNAGTTFKYTVDTTGNARITGGINYNSFSGSKDYKSGARTYKSKINIISLSAGVDYSFSPRNRINPFAGFELSANFFGGSVEASGDTTIQITRKSETRFGVLLNGGVNINLKNNVALLFGFKYALANLIGKSTESVSTTSNSNTDDEGGSTLLLIELPLNDEESPKNKSKSINYLQIYAGVSINLGEKIFK